MMKPLGNTLAEQLLVKIEAASKHATALILLVSPGGKTKALQILAALNGFPRLNLSLELSRALLDTPARDRPQALRPALEKLAAQTGTAPLLLDNLEFLFEPGLHHDPLSLLKSLARTRIIVAAWPGEISQGRLLYALPSHPESYDGPAKDLNLVTAA